MIDRRHIGHAMPPFSTEVEKGRLRFFAKATGQADPVYTDEGAARAAGYSGLPVPPTFLFCLEMDAPNPGAIRELLDLPPRAEPQPARPHLHRRTHHFYPAQQFRRYMPPPPPAACEPPMSRGRTSKDRAGARRPRSATSSSPPPATSTSSRSSTCGR